MSDVRTYPNQQAGGYASESVSSFGVYIPFHPSYLTPDHNPDTLDQWDARPYSASPPHQPTAQYATQHPTVTIPQYQGHPKDPNRPRSSPSTFGPTFDNTQWPVSGGLPFSSGLPLPDVGLGIYHPNTIGQPTPVTSTFPPNFLQPFASPTMAQQEHEAMKRKDSQQQTTNICSTSSPPGNRIAHPQPRKPSSNQLATNITATASGGTPPKRRRSEDDHPADAPQSKNNKRRRICSFNLAELSDNDRLLAQICAEKSYSWKDVAECYSEVVGEPTKIETLQMRYGRMRGKTRAWTEGDVEALRLAVEVWEEKKWEIVAKEVSFDLRCS